jgi:glycosyltransferase involved in cell wall biosynthesis
MLLARGLAQSRTTASGETIQVTVVTPTAADGMDHAALPLRVVRQPSWLALLTLLWNADVIHLAGPSFLPLVMGLILRKPVVVEHHGYQAVCPNGLLFYEPTKSICPGHYMAHGYHKCLGCNAKNIGWARSAAKLLLTAPRRWACRRVAANIAVSNHVKKRIGFARTSVIYHGIPDPLCDRDLQPERCASAGSRPVTFAYVGRLVSEKGLDLLVEAARRLQADHRSFQVKFIGDGPERPRLQTNVQAFGLGRSVIFTGYLKGADLDEALDSVDAVVMPSIWEETAGLSAIEHMMRGRLVIAADVGGLSEMVGEVGLKFPVGDVAGLTSCMKLVLDHPSLAKELGELARDRALRVFAQDRMVNDHLDTFNELFRSRGALATLVSEER